MELMSEYKNRYFQAVISVIRQIASGEIISTKYDYMERLSQEAGDFDGLDNNYMESLEEKLYSKMLERLFYWDENHKLCTDLHGFFMPLSLPERTFFLAMLQDERCRLFFDESEIQEMEKLLHRENLMPLQKYVVVRHNKGDSITEALICTFRVCIEAISGKRFVISKQNTNSNKILLPCSIEYSAMENRFALIGVDREAKTPIKMLLSDLRNLTLGNFVSNEEFQELSNVLQKQIEKDPIVILIQNRLQAIERAKIQFSSYDTVCETQENGAVRMKIRYYTYDANELLMQIFRFGLVIKVLSPENMVEKVRDMLRNRYQK